MDKRFSNPSWQDITHNLQNEIEVKYLLSLLHHSMTKILSRRLDNQVFGPLNSVLCRRNSWALVARDKHWGTGHLGDSAHLKRQGTYNEENITSNSHPWTSNVRNLNNEKTSAQYMICPEEYVPSDNIVLMYYTLINTVIQLTCVRKALVGL